MGGGLLQLVAYGAQDAYLTGNPQITFWKVVYRRHTNFSMESIEQSINGNAGYNKRITAQISRNGDLIHKMYLEMTFSAVVGASGAGTDGFVDYRGLAAIKYVELEIGGQKIDKQYGDWMLIWNELSLPTGKEAGWTKMVGGTDNAAAAVCYVPLEFWFCRNPGLALPLIALQYHDVKVNIEFEPKTEVVTGTYTSGGDLTDVKIWVDYVFLDTDERRRFSQMSHEYLITQLQFTGDESLTANGTVKLNFNHPVTELVWVVKAAGANKVTFANDVITTAKLQLNGHDRFVERPADYFKLVQPYQHHENIPVGSGIHVYSFAMNPEEHQPSGTLNMSRIDTAQLKFTNATTGTIKVFAPCYNVLRVMSGMGGLNASS